jgi:hypothetical protein
MLTVGRLVIDANRHSVPECLDRNVFRRSPQRDQVPYGHLLTEEGAKILFQLFPVRFKASDRSFILASRIDTSTAAVIWWVKEFS